jgi:hypothetical protein
MVKGCGVKDLMRLVVDEAVEGCWVKIEGLEEF